MDTFVRSGREWPVVRQISDAIHELPTEIVMYSLKHKQICIIEKKSIQILNYDYMLNCCFDNLREGSPRMRRYIEVPLKCVDFSVIQFMIESYIFNSNISMGWDI